MVTKTKAEEVEVIDVPATKENGSMVLSPDRIDTGTIIANIDAQGILLEKLITYVRDRLKPKIDYYSVKKNSLPSLGLPGAEKINNIFCLAAKPILEEKIKTTKEVSYEYIVELYNKNTGNFVGSGVGCCSSQEDKFKYFWDKELEKKVEIANHLNIANTIKKMAYKRGYVDATLKATMASFLFTQDLEDLPDYYLGGDSGDNKGSSKGKGSTSKGKYKSNEEYWQGYDFTKVDLNTVPPNRGFDKAKNKPIPSMESLKIWFYACDIMPKKEVKGFFESVTGKPKAWEYTFGDIKNILTGLEEVKKQEQMGEEEIQQGFKEQENSN